MMTLCRSKVKLTAVLHFVQILTRLMVLSNNPPELLDVCVFELFDELFKVRVHVRGGCTLRHTVTLLLRTGNSAKLSMIKW